MNAENNLQAKPPKRKADEAKMLAALDEYICAVGTEFNFQPEFSEADRDAMLKLTGIAAHNLVRPAAPLSALAAGYLVGSGQAKDWLEAQKMVRNFIENYLREQGSADG